MSEQRGTHVHGGTACAMPEDITWSWVLPFLWQSRIVAKARRKVSRLEIRSELENTNLDEFTQVWT